MSKRIRASIILAVHTALAIFLFLASSKLLNDSDNQKEGIFKVELGQNLFSRGLPIPTDGIPSQVTEVVGGAGDVAKQATIAIAQATNVVQDVQSKITSAIAAGETLLHGLVPEALAVGTTTGCVEYGGGRSDCMKFPVDDDKILGIIYNLSDGASSLVTQLGHLPSLQSLFIAGLACFATSVVYSVVNTLLVILQITSNGWLLKALAYIIISISICACGLFASFMAFVIIIWSSGRGLAEVTRGSFQSGPALWVSIASLVASASQLACLVLGKCIGV
ncbi:uncharacterized protein FPOAC1_013027 [Fusarium poae]|uniref:uncharacterized protein n=1 Tax=Fusarium poae TaxID=36050 RepID=UPI001D05475F|nr:uncharacterized protein FPOAC1_013027 [Fusarium poae]KAG8665049.1 hypothetical protein FPOAC1_013027 [Fusarium poae]